ncbi:MAG: hypothetical protein AAF532_11705 [Planctomycetota bacterium]
MDALTIRTAAGVPVKTGKLAGLRSLPGDARFWKLLIFLGVLASLGAGNAPGATYQSPNFRVTADTPAFAREVAMTAEQFRQKLARQWLGRELPRWPEPCTIRVSVGGGAGGATTFHFDRGRVFGFRMTVQGSRERILDSVIPHEVNHTIFAEKFRRPLPRWADEGAATLCEHPEEKRRQDMTLKQVWNSRRIPLAKLVQMTEYPSDMRDVMALYAQGYSLARFLVNAGGGGNAGRAKYLDFLADALKRGWDKALATHYEVAGVGDLERKWGGWVVAGSPDFGRDRSVMVASIDETDRRGRRPARTAVGEVTPAVTAEPDVTIRSQDPGVDTPAPPWETDDPAPQVAANPAEDATPAPDADGVARPQPLVGFVSYDQVRAARAARDK